MVEVLDALPQRTSDRVSVVGFADGHREQAPTDGDIWGLNRLFAVMERPWTAWFDIHDLQATYGDGRPGGRDEEWMNFCRTFAGPIYVRAQDVELARSWGILNAVAYPLDTVLSVFPRYFTNSVSYMLALAILLGYEELGIFGVDMAQDTLAGGGEYRSQRPSCELFIGAAMANGIQVFIPEGSDLLRSSHLYGVEDDTGIQLKNRARIQELAQRKEGMKQQMAQVEAEQAAFNAQSEARKRDLFAGINQLDGAMQQVQYAAVQLSPEPVQDLAKE